MQSLHIYLLIINALSFLFMRIDKKKARLGLRRIPERVLFLTALVGGSPGTLAGMLVFRHKTKHPTFVLGIPSILVAQIFIWFALRSRI